MRIKERAEVHEKKIVFPLRKYHLTLSEKSFPCLFQSSLDNGTNPNEWRRAGAEYV